MRIWKWFVIALLAPFYVTIFAVEFVWMLFKALLALFGKLSFDETVKKYTYQQAIATDQSVNTLMFGDPDESISSRAGRAFPNSRWRKLIDFIIFWQPNHCKTHIEHHPETNDLLVPSR